MKLLFVAGFGNPTAGIFGGQAAAANSLLATSLPKDNDVILLDSTMRSIPPPPVFVRFWLALRRILKFVRMLRRHRPDVALIFAADGPSFMEKAVMAYMTSISGAGVVFRMSSGLLPAQCRNSGVMRWFVRFAMRHCHRVICQSGTWRDFFVQHGMEPERGRIIRNWVDDTPFQDHPCAADAKGPVSLLFLGWADRAKGVYELVEALARVFPSHPDMKAVLAGGGGELENLRALVRKKNIDSRVLLPGWVDGEEKLDLLRGSQIFALPTHFEGLPNALLESMAAGAAVITTPVGGIPEVVVDNENGFLVPPGDIEALARAITVLIENSSLRSMMGRRNRQKIRNEFSLEKNWPSVAETLYEAASMKGIRPAHREERTP